MFIFIPNSHIFAKDNFEHCDGGFNLSIGKISQISLYTSFCLKTRYYLIDYSVFSIELGKKQDDDKAFIGASFLLRIPAIIYYIKTSENNLTPADRKTGKILLLSSLFFYGKHHFIILKNKQILESADIHNYISLFIKHSNDFFIFNEDKWMNSMIGIGTRLYYSGYFIDVGYDYHFEYNFKNVREEPRFNFLLGFSFAYAGN
jgi:hypothetical protein